MSVYLFIYFYICWIPWERLTVKSNIYPLIVSRTHNTYYNFNQHKLNYYRSRNSAMLCFGNPWKLLFVNAHFLCSVPPYCVSKCGLSDGIDMTLETGDEKILQYHSKTNEERGRIVTGWWMYILHCLCLCPLVILVSRNLRFCFS